MNDLNEAAFEFLSRLPTTIRNEIIIFVLMYSFDYVPNDLELVGALKNYLTPTSLNSGIKTFGALLRVIGATDYILFRFIKISRANEYKLPVVRQKLADDPKLSKVIETMQAGREFSLAHAEQSLTEWERLRATSLGPDSLSAYEDYCMRSA